MPICSAIERSPLNNKTINRKECNIKNKRVAQCYTNGNSLHNHFHSQIILDNLGEVINDI